MRGSRADFRPERAWGDGRINKQMDRQMNESPPVFYRTLSPSGPLPKRQVSALIPERADFGPERADYRQERADFRQETASFRQETADLRQETADFRSEKANIRPKRTKFGSERAYFRPERAEFRPGRTGVRSKRSNGGGGGTGKVALMNKVFNKSLRACF